MISWDPEPDVQPRRHHPRLPHVEGEGRPVRFMRFADVAEVNARKTELTKIVVAWCDLMSAPKGKKKA